MALMFEPVPVIHKNKIYPSIGALARHLKLHRSSVTNALNEGRLDTVGENKRGRHLATPITINGTHYRSLYAACLAHKKSRETIRRIYYRLGPDVTYKNGRWSKT